ncbi:MAG TPA: PorV/PorQ family protein [Elusimicrobiota bacterium]|nr:PorV/PorQ family protein [Elusimicrobiota bacterium]
MKRAAVLCLSLGLTGAAFGGSKDAGTASAVFLRDGQGARALGMGGAYTAVGRGVSAMFWNPGGLSRTSQMGVMTSYNTLIEDVKTQSVSFLCPLSKGEKGAIGVSAVMMNVGDIEKRDGTGTLLGEGKVKGGAYGLGYGFHLGRWGFGAQVKSVNEDLIAEKGKATAVDAGVLGQWGSVSVGLSAQNFGGKYKVGGLENDLPGVLRGGVAYHPVETENQWLERMTVSADVEKPVDQDWKVRGGGEYVLSRMLSVRAGYEQMRDLDSSGISFGLGLWTDFKKMEKEEGDYRRNTESRVVMEVDYAYLMRDVFDDLHRVTLSLHF